VVVDIYLLIKALVLPPGAQAVAGLLGLLLLGRWHRAGLLLLGLTVLSTWLMALPAGAAWLARPFESAAPLSATALATSGAEAIIVLAGGAYQEGPEFTGRSDVAPLTLERIRYAARLQRQSGLPLAVTGGLVRGQPFSEAELMRAALEQDFGVPVCCMESASRNTRENASLSAEAFPFRRVVLVTHAVHMPRSVRAFEAAGFTVVPAPMGFIARPDSEWSAIDLLPSGKAWAQSHYVIYEALGALWYLLGRD
jgi:uncharacterized SAM-binding protein YcdF (DUF218 family)